MSATNLASAIIKPSASAQAQPAEAPVRCNTPRLVCKPLLQPDRTRQFVRVPTHAVGVHPEHREYPRASLNLALKLESVNGQHEDFPVTLLTRDISSIGVYF